MTNDSNQNYNLLTDTFPVSSINMLLWKKEIKRQSCTFHEYGISKKKTCTWIVLVHDKRSSESRSNDAGFMHKSSKLASIMRRENYCFEEQATWFLLYANEHISGSNKIKLIELLLKYLYSREECFRSAVLENCINTTTLRLQTKKTQKWNLRKKLHAQKYGYYGVIICIFWSTLATLIRLMKTKGFKKTQAFFKRCSEAI